MNSAFIIILTEIILILRRLFRWIMLRQMQWYISVKYILVEVKGSFFRRFYVFFYLALTGLDMPEI